MFLGKGYLVMESAISAFPVFSIVNSQVIVCKLSFVLQYLKLSKSEILCQATLLIGLKAFGFKCLKIFVT